ncbi:hypothetical protein O181_034925 [Austropuccinia psidii MF-1]|uniref:Integrase catalytic domain-containing protein n=1 Tax=Austropuccinia psidii MF-1 TaxID=1389203 RepID=A0A9Q3D3V9_9BASI|nr:hypothetical protein [Austropuccinia psidii MF-1]
MTTTYTKSQTCAIVLDTGASNHMFNDIRFFTDIKRKINMAISTGCDKSMLSAAGEGTVPKLTTNLVALSRLAREITIKNQGSMYEIFLNSYKKPAFLCATNSGILETRVTLPNPIILYTTNEFWHDRLGHMHEEGIKKLIPSFKQEGTCRICTQGKFPKLPFQHNFQEAKHPLENVHLDLCGPMQTASIGGARYFMIIIDQFTGYINIKFLKQKSEAYTHFRNFKEHAENKHKTKILNITIDGGGEFVNNNFKKLTDESGINHLISPPYTPQHNGIAERANWTVIEKTRCLLLQSKLPPRFLAEAATTATMLCSLVQRQHKTPYQLWNDQEPPINKLRPFGCRAWVQVPEANRKGKFDPVAWEGIFLGYINQATAYRVLRKVDNTVIISRHVKFEESVFPALSTDFPNVPLQFPIFNFSFRNDHWNLSADTSDLSSDSATEGDVFHDALEELPARRIRVIGPRHPTLISSEIRTNNILPFSRRAHKTDVVRNSTAPASFKNATEGNDKQEWTLAINKELDNMKRLGVWSIEDKKANDHPITTTWVFKVKRDHNNKIIEHKARLCAQGFHQIEGLDYLNTFSPTGRISSLRVLISHAASQGFQFHQMDVKSAFLNAPLDEDLTLKIPDGLSEDSNSKVLRLHKASSTCLVQPPIEMIKKYWFHGGSVRPMCVFQKGN